MKKKLTLALIMLLVSGSVCAFGAAHAPDGGDWAGAPNDSLVEWLRKMQVESFQTSAEAYRSAAESYEEALKNASEMARMYESGVLENEKTAAELDSIFLRYEGTMDPSALGQFRKIIDVSRENARKLKEEAARYRKEEARYRTLAADYRERALQAEKEKSRADSIVSLTSNNFDGLPHYDFNKYKNDQSVSSYFFDPKSSDLTISGGISVMDICKNFEQIKGVLILLPQNFEGKNKLAADLKHFGSDDSYRLFMQLVKGNSAVNFYVRPLIVGSIDYTELIIAYGRLDGEVQVRFLVQVVGAMKREEVERTVHEFLNSR